jgi:hypothetical protein
MEKYKETMDVLIKEAILDRGFKIITRNGEDGYE